MTRFQFSNRGFLVRHTTRIMAGLLAFSCAGLIAADPRMIDEGRELFERQWTHEPPELLEQGEKESRREFERRLMALAGDGLGPMYNATSCEDCHAGGGGAGVDRNVTLLTLDPRSPALDRKTLPNDVTRKALIDLYPGLLSPRGALSLDVVVHEKSVRPFYDWIRTQIGAHIPGGAPQAWFVSEQRTTDAIADRPVLAGRVGGLDFYLSQRNSPPLFGLGLVDEIESATLQRIARGQDRRSSGRVTGRLGAGKFGWRAQTATLDQFVRGACAGELGLQVSRTPQPADVADETYISLGVDLQEPDVTRLVNYVRTLPYPMQETRLPEESAAVRDGKRLFGKIGCALCHVENVYPARGVYSDFLLHDMGDLLQAPSPASSGALTASMPRLRIPIFTPGQQPFGSGSPIGGYYGSPSSTIPEPYQVARPEQPRFPRGKVPASVLETRNPAQVTWDLLQREWRTPPLWGVADSAPYLHDGRAANLDSAIRWHSGEASDAAAEYRSLTQERRKQIVVFLASLRSPPLAPRQEREPIIHPIVTQVAADPPAIDPDSLAEAIDAFQQGY